MAASKRKRIRPSAPADAWFGLLPDGLVLVSSHPRSDEACQGWPGLAARATRSKAMKPTSAARSTTVLTPRKSRRSIPFWRWLTATARAALSISPTSRPKPCMKPSGKVVDRACHTWSPMSCAAYEPLGRNFAGHTTVTHSADEYVALGGFAHINNAEARFSLMKRAIFGAHHSVSRSPPSALPHRMGLRSGTPASSMTGNVRRLP